MINPSWCRFSRSVLMIAFGFVAFSFLCTLCPAAEKVDIKLGVGALKDPLLDVVLPPRTSKDTVQFLPNGLAIRQGADVQGKKTGVAGFKLHSNAAGDFKFMLDFECKKLEKAKAGWGQGLMIRVMTDDPATPVMAFGCVANQQFDRGWVIQINHTKDVPQERFAGQFNFEKGTWSIQRVGSELTLSIGKDSESLEVIKTVKGTDASLSGVHVWCTRQETGNSPAEYLLKRVQFEADSMFAFKEAPYSFWNWWTLIATVLGLNAIGLIIFFVRRLRERR
jgi:hypothetical protein